MREDGLRIDRLLITTDTSYIPTGYGPAETERQIGGDDLIIPLTRTLVYTYDNLYRLTEATYTTGESYQYSYDPVGNRLQQIIAGDTTDYLYDAANRLAEVNGQSYTFDDNGNLLQTGVMTNTFDAANRLVETERNETTLAPIYNGVGDRIGQTVGVTTTYFALDVMGLPEVIYTSEGNSYLHLPGVIMTESNTGEVRYLLSDGLGSVRQAVDETGAVVAYNEFDPYGNPVENGSEVYGFTGEWWQNEVGLLHLRARWLLPETGTFLSRDPVESEPAYQYVHGNPIRYVDPMGLCVRADNRTAGCPDWMADWVFDGIGGFFNTTATPAYSDAPEGQSGNIEDLRQRAEQVGTGAALPWMGVTVDFSPGYGDAKGFVEVFTDRDLATHQQLGNWRYLGLFGLSELRHLKFLDQCGSLLKKLRLIGKVPSEIRIIGFRGVGNRDIRYVNEHVLIRAGHVGISWDKGKTIYGFWPSQEVMDALTSQGLNVGQHLKDNGAVLGQVQNDTEVFKRAYELSNQGAQTEVWQISRSVSEEQLEQIVDQVLRQVTEGSPYPSWYRWPSPDGMPMPSQCNNCATWPRTVGLQPPENTGQMSKVMGVLKKQGFPWIP